MRLPRGSAFTVLSVAMGIVAAAAVGASWFPMVREREVRALEDQAQELELVALLAMDRLFEELVESDPPLLTGRPASAPDVPLPASRVEEVRTRAEGTFGRITTLADLASITLVDRRGRLLAASPSRPKALYGDLINDPILRVCELDRVVEERRKLLTTLEDDRGRVQQVICLPFRQPNGEVLGMLAVMGDQAPVISASRQSRRELFLLLIAAMVAGMVTVVGMRRLLAPLSAVVKAAARIAAGERGVRVDARGPEEIQQLARAMNALSSAVESREDEIEGRMQVVQQLSSMVAHEVRNPLQSLSLLASLARTEEDVLARNEQLQLIEDEINVLEGVVQRFLSNSGPLRIVRTRTDVVKVLDRAASICYPRANDSRVRMLVQTPDKAILEVDSSLLRRAMENLILNAIEFAARGDGRPQVMASILPREDEVLVVVDDSGPGVPEEDRERIFQPYVSSKDGGTGLGLALVRQVFQAHGGYIHCESSPLGGARFTASIPTESSTGATK